MQKDSSGEQSHAEQSGGESGRLILLAVINDRRPRQQTLTVWQSEATANLGNTVYTESPASFMEVFSVMD
jgi:hypothetical protein